MRDLARVIQPSHLRLASLRFSTDSQMAVQFFSTRVRVRVSYSSIGLSSVSETNLLLHETWARYLGLVGILWSGE